MQKALAEEFHAIWKVSLNNSPVSLEDDIDDGDEDDDNDNEGSDDDSNGNGSGGLNGHEGAL